MNGQRIEPRPRLGVCSWSLEPRSPEALFERVRSIGLRGVQLALAPLRDGAWSIDAVVRSAREHGIDIISGMMQTIGEDYSTIDRIRETGGLRPDEHWNANLANANRDAAVARELGISLVTFHAGFIPAQATDPLHEAMVERIAGIAAVFGEHGVRIALETGQEAAETLRAMLDLPALAAHSVGVNFDPANMILYGAGNPVSALRRLRRHTVQVHIKDAIESPSPGAQWGSEVPVGRGDVDWAAFFAALDDGPAVNAVIEREAGRQRVHDIRTAAGLARVYGYAP
ncbi:MAG: sugar phosphate isomerase/epimerase family protein [Phycisphaerales bacterium]